MHNNLCLLTVCQDGEPSMKTPSDPRNLLFLCQNFRIAVNSFQEPRPHTTVLSLPQSSYSSKSPAYTTGERWPSRSKRNENGKFLKNRRLGVTSSELTTLYRKMRADKSCFSPSLGALLSCKHSLLGKCLDYVLQMAKSLHGNLLRKFACWHISSAEKYLGLIKG